MKTLFIAYHDVDSEARSQETCKLLEMYGDVVCVSYCKYNNPNIKSIYNKNNTKSILRFLINAKKTIDSVKPELVVLHDNYPMIYARYIKKNLKNCKIIYDASELYLTDEKTYGFIGLKKRIARLFLSIVKNNIHYVDVVLTANEERAKIMQEYYNLEKMPIVFDNIHRIDSSYDEERCLEKYYNIINDKRTILYAGGIAEKRLTYKIALQIGKLESENVQLIIVGAKEKGGEEKLKILLERNNIHNVYYLGFVKREELKYLMEKSLVTISAFELDTINNINCASGKVYEGLFLGKPLLAGTNPPLKRLCEKYQIGISTEEFDIACMKILNNYSYYKENVKKFIDTIDYDHRLNNLKFRIDSVLHW